MFVKHSSIKWLALAIGCAPAASQTATTPMPEVQQSAAVGFPCAARQPDLSVGVAVYLKGLVTLNGEVLANKGVSLRHGDRIGTANDGFIAVELGSGKLVSIAPGASVTLDCSAATPDVAGKHQYTVGAPHMFGVIRG